MGNQFDRLELGQNVFELIEFSLFRNLPDGTVIEGIYGVNVAKVREVVRMPKINKLSSRLKGIEGVFELRGIPIPAINLAVALGDKEAKLDPNQQIIVTEFSQKRAGFIVSSTHRIRRIAWEKVLPPAADADTCINGMTLIENNEFLFILDLEKILIDLEGQSGFGYSNSHNASSRNFVSEPSSVPTVPKIKRGCLLLVDDSNLILKNCQKSLETMGYEIIPAKDGKKAQEILMDYANGLSSVKKIDAVVTDVEMPRMDGLTLTKWIRDESLVPDIPVIMHTSLSGQSNQEAGYSVGANGYVVKNDIRRLTHLLGEILGGNAALDLSA